MNILITGANGFVGKVLVNELSKTSHKLFLVSRESFVSKVGEILIGDLTDKEFCKKIVKSIDTVFYLAGYKKNIAFHTKNPNDFVVGNVEPLMAFLDAVKSSHIKKIIYLSSINVRLYKEGEEDGYIVGKYINELLLTTFAKQSTIDVKIVRVPGIYGPGDNFNSDTANFIPSMIRKVFESDKNMEVWGTGSRQIQFIYIEDLVSNLIAIEESKDNFFEIGNQESLTINEITEKIITLSGKNIEINNDKTKPDKPSKLFTFVNIKEPVYNLDKGLEETIEYYKNLHA